MVMTVAIALPEDNAGIEHDHIQTTPEILQHHHFRFMFRITITESETGKIVGKTLVRYFTLHRRNSKSGNGTGMYNSLATGGKGQFHNMARAFDIDLSLPLSIRVTVGNKPGHMKDKLWLESKSPLHILAIFHGPDNVLMPGSRLPNIRC